MKYEQHKRDSCYNLGLYVKISVLSGINCTHFIYFTHNFSHNKIDTDGALQLPVNR